MPHGPDHGHDPVLPREILAFLDPAPDAVVVDCTLGRGGHARLLAERLDPGGTLVGLDVDPDNLDYARGRLAGVACGLRLVHANYVDLPDVLADAGVGGADALLADLGVSTNQLLPGDGRGLSFDDPDAPLDMRLDPRLDRTAADLVARLPERELADLIFGLAQERKSRRVARRIVEARRDRPIRTVGDLAAIVRRSVPRSRHGPDPATRTFMALRMAVNRELDGLAKLLDALPAVLNPGGRAAVVSFHSGEDRLVKHALRRGLTGGLLELPTRKPITPDADERDRNPRSRSAKLRLARKPTPDP